ncbi:DUF1833 family protein [Megalodesulfovibrio gigas]|uniref:Uncharacterized protein n=1 Tax=Megalodesulfovibrio gigas (strain ATCC 19364 / DSM 1382 / NCIMB 9332 / VKM B-1759) TaxID=1121448 RepID=T2GBX3_MEGG1|nr:DUF1833 family protein [Megalodesulfovibrio gigas]AGW13808.1 hypothetical protein DGI_2039 [Megalodesulfovibrio gigas DSM 1382 = ATCC 19364]
MDAYYATLDDAQREACAYADPQDTIFETLTITHAALHAPIMVVFSHDALPTPQGTYLPAQFELQLPGLERRTCGEMRIRTGALTRGMHRALYDAGIAGPPIEILYRQYRGPNQPPSMEFPLPLEVAQVDHAHGGAEASARVANMSGVQVPRAKYTSTTEPGLIS